MEIQAKDFDQSKFNKTALYRISNSRSVIFEESGGDDRNNIVEVFFDIKENQYGLIAKEFRSPIYAKDGCKCADIFASIIDNNKKEILTFIADVKTNISSFSDGLREDKDIATAVKEVRDFIKQIETTKINKESLFVHFKYQSYSEKECFGIITSTFESNKFLDVAKKIEEILSKEPMDLLGMKTKLLVQNYSSEISKLKLFAEKKILICNEMHVLQVLLLNGKDKEKKVYIRMNELEYAMQS